MGKGARLNLFKVGEPILIVEETGRAVMATLDDVQR